MTPYSKVFNRFLIKIKDYSLVNKLPVELDEFLIDLMTSAMVKFPRCKSNLSNRDDTLKQFNETLLEVEQEIIAILMVSEWIEPRINDVMLLEQVLNDTDFKIYSQANHLKEMLILQEKTNDRVELMMTRYSYDTVSTFEDLA